MPKEVHGVVARSTFGSKHVKNTWGSDDFLTSLSRFDVENVHAVVARSAFKSQKVSKAWGFEPLLADL